MRTPAAIAAGVLLVLGALVTWTGLSARGDLREARDIATDLQSALVDNNEQESRDLLGDLLTRTTSAHDRTHGIVWRSLGHLPIVGDDAQAVADATEALRIAVREGVTPLVNESAKTDRRAFLPRNGKVDFAAITRTQPTLAEVAEAFGKAQDATSDIDTRNYIGPVADGLDEFLDLLDRSAGAAHASAVAAEILPAMLGRDGARRYLLAFQNNAELRSLGGVPGSMMVLNANAGELKRGQSASTFGRISTNQPVVPLTDEELDIYDSQLGVWGQNATMTPDFPRAAEILAARWQHEKDQSVDGVIAADPVALSYLLKATGPITVDGVKLTSDNLVEEVLNEAYQRLTPRQTDAWFAKVAAAAFDKIVSGDADTSKLFKGLARAAQERRLLVHSFDFAEQGKISGTRAAGELPVEATERPQLGVYINDATLAKLNYYLDYQMSARATSCEDDQQTISSTLRLTSKVPPVNELAPYITGSFDMGVKGDQLLAAHIYGPVGGELDHFTFDGKKHDIIVKAHHGRPVASLVVAVKRGETVTVTWDATTAEGQNGTADVIVTPGVVPGDESLTVPSAC